MQRYLHLLYRKRNKAPDKGRFLSIQLHVVILPIEQKIKPSSNEASIIKFSNNV